MASSMILEAMPTKYRYECGAFRSDGSACATSASSCALDEVFVRPKEEAMWQLHAAFRLGSYRTPELDVTPVVGITLIVAVIGMIIQTGL
jgi:hypothetical protein